MADLPLLNQWLQAEYARIYFGVPEDWLHEIEANLNAGWIHHFIVEAEVPFAFAQFYDAHLAPLGIWSEAPLDAAGIDFLIGNEDFLGKGFGSKIVAELVETIKASGNFDHIIADPTAENTASIRVLEKNGFQPQPSGLHLLQLSGDPWKLYHAKVEDVQEITDLFYNTIQFVNIHDYTQEQVDDWSYWHSAMDKWKHGILHQYFIKATDRDQIVGFGSLREDGYVDYLFSHKDHQHRGVGSSILEKLEKHAKAQDNESIFTDASITAKKFFEKHGYVTESEQLKKSHYLELVNYRMRKDLANK